ncbi:MAG: cytidylate kinase-like family protein [Planctomycetaceae bacterium]|nr:cytidylate kinase-like family protein [Planctomycetaceae bacterium]
MGSECASAQQDATPHIAISREAGAGGSAVGRRIGELLQWEVLNRKLLDMMAEKFNLSRAMVGVADETTSNWLIEVFGKWLDPRLVTRSEYIVHLGELVLLAAQHSSKVFVGRGAQHFLPAERGVSVFLVAPLTMRIARIQDVRGCSEAEARRYIRDTDQTRRDLIKSHFNREIDDPHLYDLVINRTQIDSDAAAELVVNECRRRFSLT